MPGTIPFFFFFFFFLQIDWFIWKTDKQFLLSTNALLKWSQQPGFGEAAAGNWNSILVFHMDSRGPSILCLYSLPVQSACLPRCVSRKLRRCDSHLCWDASIIAVVLQCCPSLAVCLERTPWFLGNLSTAFLCVLTSPLEASEGTCVC